MDRVYTPAELNLILYFETCLVDLRGRTEARKMNAEDFAIAENLKAEGLIEFGRLTFKTIKALAKICPGAFTHYVRFTDQAWAIAHAERRARSARMLTKVKPGEMVAGR